MTALSSVPMRKFHKNSVAIAKKLWTKEDSRHFNADGFTSMYGYACCEIDSYEDDSYQLHMDLYWVTLYPKHLQKFSVETQEALLDSWPEESGVLPNKFQVYIKNMKRTEAKKTFLKLRKWCKEQAKKRGIK